MDQNQVISLRSFRAFPSTDRLAPRDLVISMTTWSLLWFPIKLGLLHLLGHVTWDCDYVLMSGLRRMTVPYEVPLPHCFAVLVKSVDDSVQLRQGSAISSWFVYELFCVKNGPKPMFLRGVPMMDLGCLVFPIMFFSQFQEVLCMCGGWGIILAMVMYTLFLRDRISLT